MTRFIEELTFTRSYLTQYADSMDAAVFSGDAFIDAENRKALRAWMARWEKAMVEWDQFDKGEPT